MVSPEALAISGPNLGSFVTNSKAPPLIPQNVQEAMLYPDLPARVERAVWGKLPAQTQTDPNLATLDDFNAGWEAIWSS